MYDCQYSHVSIFGWDQVDAQRGRSAEAENLASALVNINVVEGVCYLHELVALRMSSRGTGGRTGVFLQVFLRLRKIARWWQWYP